MARLIDMTFINRIRSLGTSSLYPQYPCFQFDVFDVLPSWTAWVLPNIVKDVALSWHGIFFLPKLSQLLLELKTLYVVCLVIGKEHCLTILT